MYRRGRRNYSVFCNQRDETALFRARVRSLHAQSMSAERPSQVCRTRARHVAPLSRRDRRPYNTDVDIDPVSQLPAKFVVRLHELLPPQQLDAALANFTADKTPTFRVNPLRGDDAGVLDELRAADVSATPVEGLPHVYRAAVEDRQRLVHSPALRAGRICVQNISRLLAAPLLDLHPGQHVLDLAAAPGGKTLHIAVLLNNTGTLAAVESARPRFYRLKNNLTAHGVTRCRTYLKDGRHIGKLCPERFDRVLLDAPCSGQSQMRSDATDGRPNWSERKIRQCAGKQRALLHSAIDACVPGGLIMYCTCSLAPEENEAVITSVLEHCAGRVTVDPPSLPAAARPRATAGRPAWQTMKFAESLVNAVRIVPDRWFDAFFLCRLRKC